MRTRARLTRAAAVLFVLSLLAAVAVAAGVTSADFSGTSPNAANQVDAATDFVGPSASRSVVAKSQGGIVGFAKQGGTYYVYAQVTDSGNPASGIASVEAVSGATTVPLSPGSFSAGGLSYNYRSALQTLPIGVAEGPISFQIDATDNAGNAKTTSGFALTVDNTAPTGTTVQTANATGGTAGLVQAGDSITYTTSEQIDPISVLSTWTGGSANVVVRVNNATNDNLQVWNSTNTAQVPLGTVNLGRTDYVGANRTYGLTGTPSTITQPTTNTIRIVLGTASGSGTSGTGTGTMIWTPQASAFDRAANAMSTATATESGTADREF